MKAMVFAAGVGSRLREVTKDTPKCLVDIGGQTILEHVVTRLKATGVSAIAINVHHHSDKVIAFVKSKAYFGLEVAFSHEPTLLDTGGGLKRLAPFFSGEELFLIHNADIYSDIDLHSMVEAHRSRDAIATLAIMNRESKRGLYFDSRDRLIGWSEDSTSRVSQGKLFGFCGVSVASPLIFNFMDDTATFSIIRPFLAAAQATERVYGHVYPGSDWVDIGTPENLQRLRDRLATP